MSDTPAGRLLLQQGALLGRSADQMQPIIQKVVAEGWYDSVESLRSLVEGEGAVTAGIPQRLVDKLREFFQQSMPELEPVLREPAPITMASIAAMVAALEAEIEDQVEVPAHTAFLQSLETLLAVSGNILREPATDKFRQVKTSSAKFQNSVARWSCAIAIVREMGFELDLQENVFVMPEWAKLRKLSLFHEALEAAKMRPISAAFNPYKETAVSTAGTAPFSISPEREMELATLRKEAEEIKKQIQGKDRKIGQLLEPPRLVQLGMGVAATAGAPADNEDDALILLASLKSISASSEQAQRFKSRERTELEKLKKIQHLPKTTRVRVAFADKVALELLVHSNETISNIYRMVAECLVPKMKESTEWVLTVTPPLRKLDRQSKATLIQEDFVPAIMFRIMVNGVHVLSRDVIDVQRIK